MPEAYTTTRQSKPCGCGGKIQDVPDKKLDHLNSYKHKTWEFETLCVVFLNANRKDRIEILKQMRELIATGKVM